MTKQDLIKEVAERTGKKQSETAEVVNALFEVITEAVSSGEKISIVGFGRFEKRHRAGRTGQNPRTGEKVKVPESFAPAFKAGKLFKDACNR